MSKRRRTHTRPARRQISARQKLLGVLALPLAVVLIVGGVQVGSWFPDRAAENGHAHEPPLYGGSVVAVGAGDDHCHLEVVREKGGFVVLYALADDARRVVELESQVLDAQVRGQQSGLTSALEFLPFPQPADGDGKTSRFLTKLPRDLGAQTVTISIAPIAFGRGRYPVSFMLPVASPPDRGMGGKKGGLFAAGGKYLDTDIEANGRQTPEEKFVGFQMEHDLKPRAGDKICPITRAKARPGCSWVVGGKGYEFCCPPCIERFVQAAREQPTTIEKPENYVKQQ